MAGAGTVLTARASGTEPKIKFYIGLAEKTEGLAMDEAVMRADKRVAVMEKEIGDMVGM